MDYLKVPVSVIVIFEIFFSNSATMSSKVNEADNELERPAVLELEDVSILAQKQSKPTKVRCY